FLPLDAAFLVRTLAPKLKLVSNLLLGMWHRPFVARGAGRAASSWGRVGKPSASSEWCEGPAGAGERGRRRGRRGSGGLMPLRELYGGERRRRGLRRGLDGPSRTASWRMPRCAALRRASQVENRPRRSARAAWNRISRISATSSATAASATAT